MNKSKDNLGDRMKMYESQTTSQKLIPLIPAFARLDGNNFSKFTKGLKRPFDERLSQLMIDLTKYLVEISNANCAYTQSDEITLVWYQPSPKSSIYQDGRIFKMETHLAAKASVWFNRELPKRIPEKADLMPSFDCRVWNVPNQIEAYNCFLWREQDATKNSISMAARTVYSHSKLDNKNGKEMQEMLFQKNINWNDYPNFFKRGSYVQRQTKLIKFSQEELKKLPVKHEARLNPDLMINRRVVEVLELLPISQIGNAVGVLLNGEEPIIIKTNLKKK